MRSDSARIFPLTAPAGGRMMGLTMMLTRHEMRLTPAYTTAASAAIQMGMTRPQVEVYARCRAMGVSAQRAYNAATVGERQLTLG
jgi:hypothetical protein